MARVKVMATDKPRFTVGNLPKPRPSGVSPVSETLPVNLEEEAMLVYLYIGSFNRERVDSEASEHVARRARTRGPEVGDYMKRLLPADAVKPINKLRSKMRDEHYNLTLGWSYQGWRVLPATLYGTYVQRIDKLIKERKTAADRLLKEYPSLKRAERARLGTLFDAKLYPTVDQLRERIVAEYSFAPMPSARHFVVVGMSERERTRIRVDIEKTVQKQVADTALELHSRLEKHIQVVAKQLAPKGRLYESSLDNLREAAGLVPHLNLTDNAGLNEVSNSLINLLGGVTAYNLRHNAQVRTRVKVEVDRLSERFAIGAMLPPMP